MEHFQSININERCVALKLRKYWSFEVCLFGLAEFIYYFFRILSISWNFIRVWKTRKSFEQNLTLSLLGYLKTRICWGGQFDPPSKSHVLCPNMTNDTSLESSWALLLESAKKLQICKNWIFYCKIQLYSKKVCKK